ncbi:serine/threonine-protein kinase [Actinomycetospora straminea]|uniref:Protein kinase domain-containing protein n=1 Tax=Actinomycetospora straminea TaxID=663607 RepID=A0ABP9EHR6_9PSEU|nr:serine/threonine-protein kinase [Actinomycetospora straminea]MDD7935685.1 serine/threonine-protein kinase [Actinomycetospora straminea]
MEPRRFGPYRLERLIEAGSTGEVYEAVDVERDRPVALKLSPDDPDLRERFRRACRLAARLRDPHVIPIHDYGEVDRRPYLEMRLVEDGVTLASLLRTDGPLEPGRAVRLVAQVAEALDAAHDDGLVHGDVRAENVLVTPEDFVYLVDFGAAGAPEEVDPREDVAALARLLRACVPGTGSALDAVVARGVAGHHPSAGALATAARQALETPPPPPDPAPRTGGLTLVERGAGALVLAVAAALLAVTLVGRPEVVAAPRPGVDEPIGVGHSHAVPEITDLVPTAPTPSAIAIAGDGRSAWIAHRDLRTVTVLDPFSRATVATIPVPSPPRAIVLDPAGQQAVVTCRDEGGTVDRVVTVDVPTRTVTRTEERPAGPDDVAVTAGRVYAVDRGSDRVAVLDPATGAALSTIPVGRGPVAVAPSPDGSRLAVANRGDDSVSLIDVRAGRVAATVAVGDGPEDVAFAPDGAYVYTADAAGRTVTSVDVGTGRVSATVQVGGSPTAVAPEPHGRLAYVTLVDEARLATLSIGH